MLAQAFARSHGVASLPEEFTSALACHHWPGNVRELRNAVEAYLALGVLPASSDLGNSEDIDLALSRFVNPNQTYAAQKDAILQRFTRAYLARLLQATGGNQSEAARQSGLERSYLGKLLARIGLRRE